MNVVKTILKVLPAMYLLVLLILPCKDNCDHSTHEAPKTVEQAHNHHQQEKDNCTPFCVCSCCATPVIVQAILPFQLGKPAIGSNHSSFYTSFSSAYFGSIWQPPKIAA
jgi:hypothetical protein